MPNTFELIASSTVGAGGAADITFSSIANTWTDLVLDLSLRSNRASVVDGISIRFNNDTTSGNYSSRRLYGDGSGTNSDVNNCEAMPFADGANATASTWGNAYFYIPNYASTTTYKSISVDGVSETNATTIYAGLAAGLWSSNSAITSIKLTPQIGTLWSQYSTAYLYGVKNA